MSRVLAVPDSGPPVRYPLASSPKHILRPPSTWRRRRDRRSRPAECRSGSPRRQPHPRSGSRWKQCRHSRRERRRATSRFDERNGARVRPQARKRLPPRHGPNPRSPFSVSLKEDKRFVRCRRYRLLIEQVYRVPSHRVQECACRNAAVCKQRGRRGNRVTALHPLAGDVHRQSEKLAREISELQRDTMFSRHAERFHIGSFLKNAALSVLRSAPCSPSYQFSEFAIFGNLSNSSHVRFRVFFESPQAARAAEVDHDAAMVDTSETSVSFNTLSAYHARFHFVLQTDCVLNAHINTFPILVYAY